MTLYNLDRLRELKQELIKEVAAGERNDALAEVLDIEANVNKFIAFIESKENKFFTNPGQLEIPFPDEDNSK